MDSGASPDWLPAGWTEQVEVKNGRKVKYYSNMETGQKFHSKNDVIRYVTMANICHTTPQQESKRKRRSLKNQTVPLEEKSNETPEWLPQGWSVELKIRKSGANMGRTYKCYIDPLIGRKFYSKPEVYEYLRTAKPNSCTSPEEKMDPDSVINPNLIESTGGESSLKQQEHQDLKTPRKMSSASKKKQEGFSKLSINTCESNGGGDSLKQDKHQNWRTSRKISSTSKKQEGFSKQSPDMYASTRGKNSLKQEENQNLQTPHMINSASKKQQEGLSEPSVVIERVPANGLPPGWIKEIKVVKKADKIRRDPYYTDPVSGYVFVSLPDALRYVETGDINKCIRKPKKREKIAYLNEVTPMSPAVDGPHGGNTPLKIQDSPDVKTLNEMSGTPEKEQFGSGKQSVVIERVTPNGLPPGWIKEIKVEKMAKGIRKDPYYTDPVSGYVFRSQKDVLRYLETGDVNKCSIKPKQRDKLEFLDRDMSGSHNMGEPIESKISRKQGGTQNLKAQNDSDAHKKKQVGYGQQSVVLERVTPNRLPQGWIKEIKIEKKAGRTRKDPYYTDPASGYVFLSEKDALRYVETGDIDKCVIKPKKRNELKFLNEEISPNTEELTGGKASIKLKGSQHLETAEGMNRATRQMKTDFGQDAVKKVVIERVKPNGLPSGWIKEIKIETKGSKTRKDPFYTDPASGFVFVSLKDALRYLETGDIKSCNRKPQKRGDLKFLNEETSPVTGELTGGKTMVKQVGCQNLKTVRGTTGASKHKQTGSSKRPSKKVVIERVAPDGLPSGWIKEIKIEKKPNGTRKDPYYTDPKSGYVFRSQKDALRYLETGDLSGCAIKPKKREEVGFLDAENYLPSADNTQELGHHATKRRLFSGTENGVASSLEKTGAGGQRKRQRKRASADTVANLTPASDILEGKHSNDNEVEEGDQTKGSGDPSGSPLPRTRGSKSKQSKVASAENGTVTIPTEMVQGEKLAQSGKAESRKSKTQVESGKSNKRREFSLPSRSSKRLTGVNPDMVVNLVLSELALGDGGAERSSESEPKTNLEALDDVAERTQQSQSVVEMGIGHHVSKDKEAPPEVETSNTAEKREQDEPEKPEKPEQDEPKKPHQEEDVQEQVPYPLGDSWPDPCLEFAFKTLTGAIAVEDNVGIQGFGTDVSGLSAIPNAPGNPAPAPPLARDPRLSDLSTNPDTHRDPVSVQPVAADPTHSAVPEFRLPNFLQGDVSSKSEIAANPMFLRPGNASFPNWINIAPQQQASFEENQVNQGKGNS